MMNLEELIVREERKVTSEVVSKIDGLTTLLAGIRTSVNAGYSLNTLGEIQGVAVQLDCRIVALATLRDLLNDTGVRHE
jgi:hypothetical protein